MWPMLTVNRSYDHGKECTQRKVYIYYCPQTKLREGNVFTRVCHSVHTPSPQKPDPTLRRQTPSLPRYDQYADGTHHHTCLCSVYFNLLVAPAFLKQSNLSSHYGVCMVDCLLDCLFVCGQLCLIINTRWLIIDFLLDWFLWLFTISSLINGRLFRQTNHCKGCHLVSIVDFLLDRFLWLFTICSLINGR